MELKTGPVNEAQGRNLMNIIQQARHIWLTEAIVDKVFTGD